MYVAIQCQAEKLMSAKVAILKLIPPLSFSLAQTSSTCLGTLQGLTGLVFSGLLLFSHLDDDCQSQRNQEYQVLAFLYSLNNCLDCFFLLCRSICFGCRSWFVTFVNPLFSVKKSKPDDTDSVYFLWSLNNSVNLHWPETIQKRRDMCIW